MPRSKPYTKKLAIMDAILTFFTGGCWLLFVVPFREMYRFNGQNKAIKKK